jgi:hypothetical protein
MAAKVLPADQSLPSVNYESRFVCTVRVYLACLVFGNGLKVVEEKHGGCRK